MGTLGIHSPVRRRVVGGALEAEGGGEEWVDS